VTGNTVRNARQVLLTTERRSLQHIHNSEFRLTHVSKTAAPKKEQWQKAQIQAALVRSPQGEPLMVVGHAISCAVAARKGAGAR
jgi:predicted alpha/beta hydrolase family esterase